MCIRDRYSDLSNNLYLSRKMVFLACFGSLIAKIGSQVTKLLFFTFYVSFPQYWGLDGAYIAGLFDGAVSHFMSGGPS